MPIDAHTRFVSLLGYPLGHSLSPEIHNTAFQAQSINMVYLCMEVHPDNLKRALDGFKAAKFVGSNVTIPHKQAVFELVDELSDQAKAVGAVNTVVCRYGKDGEVESLYGDNTDIRGFLDPLAPHASGLKGAEMVIWGAGGAARAVAYAMLTEYAPASLTIVARNVEKAGRLAEYLSEFDRQDALKVADFGNAASEVRNSRLLVNATPLGMHNQADVSPWQASDDFSAGQIVYDLIYNPQNTRLLKEAAISGAHTLGGLEMLIGQAAASYQQWTNQEMPLDVVREAVKRRLASQ
ncbi:MAG: shikimate dehydrogenase [Rhodothermales bacterium]